MSSLKSQQSASSAWEPETQAKSAFEYPSFNSGGSKWAQRQIDRIRRDKNPPALPNIGKQMPSRKDIQESVQQIDTSFTLDKNDTLFTTPDGDSLWHYANTRISFRLNDNGFTIFANPPLQVAIKHAPDTQIHRIDYSFETCAFTVQGPGMLYRSKIESAINAQMKNVLPAKLRNPAHRYSVKTDPNLDGTMEEVQAAIRTQLPNTTQSMLPNLSRLNASVDVTLPAGDTEIPLDSEYKLKKKAGTKLSITAATIGQGDRPFLDHITLRVNTKDGLCLVKREPFVSGLEDLFIKQITIRPGGKFEFDYDLRATRVLGYEPPAITEYVHEQLAAKLTPILEDMVNNYDDFFEGTLKGVRLTDVFNIAKRAPRPGKNVYARNR